MVAYPVIPSRIYNVKFQGKSYFVFAVNGSAAIVNILANFI